jgi:hypothetical protein
VNIANSPLNVAGAVAINGTPTVNVASLPALTGVTLSGNVPVVNPVDSNGNPVAVFIHTDDDASRTPVGARCLTGTIQTDGVESRFECTLFTVPGGQRLVIQSFSVSVTNVNAGTHPIETSLQTFTNGLAFGMDLPLFLQDTNTSGDNLTGQVTGRIYADPNATVACLSQFHVQVPTQGALQCSISGQLVTLPK